MTVINYAHRGASGYRPENTMLAFEYAIELGATGFETDVQLTADGVPVLIHDESLLRTTGVDVYVKDMSYDEIKQLDAGSWFDPQFKDATIPTLEELLQLGRKHKLIINLELKNGLVLYPDLEEKVIELIEKYDYSDNIIISSFNHYSLKKCHTLRPLLKTGILYMEGIYEPWHYAKSIGATKLHAPFYAAYPQWISEAKEHGCQYNVYTVNDDKQMQEFIAAGVAGIITDYPDKLAALLQQQN